MFSVEVNEAKRRGLTEQQCARLIGRFTKTQIASATSPHSTPKFHASSLRNESDDALCNRAIKGKSPLQKPTIKLFQYSDICPPHLIFGD